MPDWKRAGPDPDADDNDLDKIALELSRTVSADDAPSMEEVAGITAEELSNHAAKAVASYLSYKNNAYRGPLSLIHLYTMGFVVGVRWQQSIETEDPDAPESEKAAGST